LRVSYLFFTFFRSKYFFYKLWRLNLKQKNIAPPLKINCLPLSAGAVRADSIVFVFAEVSSTFPWLFIFLIFFSLTSVGFLTVFYVFERKRTKGQITIYKTLHKKPKIEEHEPHLKPVMNACAPGGLAVSVPLVASIVLLI
jgi:hypothetical protein